MLPREEAELAAWLGDLAREGLGEAAWMLDAGPGHARTPGMLEMFADELGHRRPVDRALLAHVLGLGAGVVAGNGAELEYWKRSLRAEGRGAGAGCVAEAERAAVAAPEGDGPLVPGLRERGIESWTEAELIALHGLSIGAWNDSSAWRRCQSAARWLMAEIQPDNATNRPWAAHVFLRMWAREGDVDARMYAETLVNNCRVSLGRVDRLSGLILGSAARVMGGGT